MCEDLKLVLLLLRLKVYKFLGGGQNAPLGTPA